MVDDRRTAVIIGASGGIGRALVTAVTRRGQFDRILALSRDPQPDDDHVHGGYIDVSEEPSIAAAAARIDRSVDLVMIATGMLHDGESRPEKALRELDARSLQRSFTINTIGPALVLKYFTPLLWRDRRAVIAALSARVGSISDNRSGGWYGYRASKAALNMVMKSAAIELRRTRPLAVCVSLHPGTVETPLSRPYRDRISRDRLFTPDRAARQLLDVLEGIDVDQSGKAFAWDGTEISP